MMIINIIIASVMVKIMVYVSCQMKPALLPCMKIPLHA